ncbi:MAG: hypothetical protein IAF94_19115 [Pirellulaceae bacterium]|nr:hypothetical protein [Pirellulaceae bacterium]
MNDSQNEDADPVIDKEVAEIVRRHLGIKTLDERKSDRQDFYDLSVWQIQESLRAAYQAGRNAR